MNQTNIDAKISTLKAKFYFSIKEVSRFCDEKDSVLRHWEQEFRQLNPKKIQGQRRYEKKDIITILTIKELLREDRMTTEGVRQFFLTQKKPSTSMQFTSISAPKAELDTSGTKKALIEIQTELKNLLVFM